MGSIMMGNAPAHNPTRIKETMPSTMVPTNNPDIPMVPTCANDANAEKAMLIAVQVVMYTFEDLDVFWSSVSCAVRASVEKRHNIAHVLRRRLSTEVDSAAKVEVAALSDIVKFSFADAVVDDIRIKIGSVW